MEILKVAPDFLTNYSDIPIRLQVESVFEITVVDGGLGGFLLNEVKVPVPYLKDYDAYEHEKPPDRWLKFDVSHWGFFQAFEDDELIGCATVACRSPGLSLLEGNEEIAMLWDIRVAPRKRRSSVGSRLFAAAAEFARAEGYRQLRIETQNTNAPACRFYRRQGCRLEEIRRFHYKAPELRDDVMLMWALDL